MKIETDQAAFFDKYNRNYKNRVVVSTFFSSLFETEINNGLRWIADCRAILDYGCGVGDMIERYLAVNGSTPIVLTGVDISRISLDHAAEIYPNYRFHHIVDNDLSIIPTGSVDAVYLCCVLHHSLDHEKILGEISRVLRPRGKLLLIDLTKTNPLIEFARWCFPFMPKSIQRLFPDDLVADGSIPERLEVDFHLTLTRIRSLGFEIDHIERGQLFVFLFDWLERIFKIYISRSRLRIMYIYIYKFEKLLVKLWPFSHFSQLFSIAAVRCSRDN